jgi:hypothetical protein
MRKFWTLVLAPVLALAFFVLGTPSAQAFGSEVLGCGSSPTYTWTANACDAGDGIVLFSPHNLSGSYSYRWTITQWDGSVLTSSCNGSTYPCISSGCTTTSSTCYIETRRIIRYDRTVTASLRLTQSGQSRTIQATATIGHEGLCINCST